MTPHASFRSIARGARPDAETDRRIYLIKNVPRLRATYQIRLLAIKALDSGKVLVLRVPPACEFDRSLRDLMGSAPHLIHREDR